MTEKKSKSKVGGTRIRAARKPSIISLIVLGFLSLGAAAWFIYQSLAGTTGAFNVFIYRDGAPNVASNLGVTIKNVGSTGSCANGFNSTGIWNGEWQGTINYASTINRIISGCNTGSNGNKVFQIVNANTTGNGGYIFTGAQVSYSGGAFQNMVPPYQFVVYDGSDSNKTRVIINYSSPPPPPPPPPPPAPQITQFNVSPSSLPYTGGRVGISVRTSNATSCNMGPAGTPISGSFPVNFDVTPSAPFTSTTTLTLSCSGSGGSVQASRTITVAPPPTVNFSGNQNIPYNSTTTLSWTASNVSSCYLGSSEGMLKSVDNKSGSWTSPNLTKGITYSLACLPSGGGTSVAKSLAITVGGQPPPPVPDGCGPGTKNNRCTNNPGTGGGTTTTGKTSTTVANTAPASGSQKPSAPGNLRAEETNGAVDLTWDASTDDNGIANYIIERSTDNKEWTTLSESSDTSYSDTDASFNTLYYYRVSAKDNDGNVSDYAVVEITTGEFEANAFKDSDSTIQSDDGVVVARIPAGALSEDAACEIVIDEESQGALGDREVLHGPYKLVCKKKDGSIFDKFDKPVTYEVSISDEAKKQNPALYGFADNQWTNSNIEYAKDAPNFTFESDTPAPFAVLSESSFPWLWIILLLLLIAALVGGFLWWRKRNSDDGSYVGSDYNPSTMYGDASAPTQSAASPGAMTIPSSPAPGSSQAPGQHQIDVTPTPVHNPALEHHSPLDRLNEMEGAETKQDIPGDLTAPGDTAAGGVQPKDPGK